MNRPWLMSCVAAVTIAPAALADSFRCGNYLVREGMAAAEIREKCGEPTTVETIVEPVMARRSNGTLYQTGEAVTEYWLYERGSGRFPARLTISEGRATAIELLSRS